MDIELEWDGQAAVRAMQAETDATVTQVTSSIATAVRQRLKRKGAIWPDRVPRRGSKARRPPPGYGRKGFRARVKRGNIEIRNVTAHGTILPRSPQIRGRPNPYYGGIARLIKREWPSIVEDATTRARTKAERSAAR